MLGPMITIRKSEDRGQADHGWLQAKHSFSFAEYYDPAHMHFRSLRVINEDRVAAGHGFPPHPHRDMEILTYVISGRLAHRDSMGNGRVIEPGQLQYMSAGSGVQHSEMNPSKTDPVHLLQIWIVPNERGAEPRYAEWGPVGSAAPLTLVASPDGQEGSMSIRADMRVSVLRLEPGGTLTVPIAAGRHAWVQVFAGEGRVNGQALVAGDAAGISGEAAVEFGTAGGLEALVFDLA